jgi:hypothetical protein
MLRNPPKHHFGSNGIDGCFATSVPELVHSGPKHKLFNFYVQRLEKWSKSLPNIIWGPMYYDGCYATSVPRNSAYRPETQVLHQFRCRRRNFGTRNSAYRPETQVLHHFTCRSLAKYFETLPNIILGLME